MTKKNKIRKPYGALHANQNLNHAERQDKPLYLMLDGTLKQDTNARAGRVIASALQRL